MQRDLLKRLQAARAAKLPTALVTALSSGAQALVIETEPGKREVSGPLALDQAQMQAVVLAIAAERSRHLAPASNQTDQELFIQVFSPPLRLIVVGAVHISQSLVPMASMAGFNVILIDPRRAWASHNRFPNVDLQHDWPDDAIKDLELDRRSAVVALTHDPKLDDPALDAALRSNCFYIGALGSRRSHGKRLGRLRDLGHSDETLARIHGPVGLDIGAKSPSEIAVSILAEVIQIQRANARAPKVAGLLLAAGQSRRMGAANKLTEALAGATMLERSLANLKASRANPLQAVSGHDYEAIETLLDAAGVKYVHNPAFAEGLSTSLKRGLAALPTNIDGVVVCLGDMPKVSTDSIDCLIAAFKPSEGRAICVPSYRGKRGNPMLFASRFIPELQNLRGDMGARGLLSLYPDFVCEVPVDDPGILADADTPEDLARLRQS